MVEDHCDGQNVSVQILNRAILLVVRQVVQEVSRKLPNASLSRWVCETRQKEILQTDDAYPSLRQEHWAWNRSLMSLTTAGEELTHLLEYCAVQRVSQGLVGLQRMDPRREQSDCRVRTRSYGEARVHLHFELCSCCPSGC